MSYDLPRPSFSEPDSGRTPYRYLKRLLQFRQMDFESATWQAIHLCTNPRKVYRNVQYHRETKRQWARDDPAFLVILAAALFISSIIVAVIFSLNFAEFMGFFLWAVFADCIGVGAIIASGFWYITNHHMTGTATAHAVAPSVEWMFCFDVHCNAFFPLLLILHGLQMLLVPILIRGGFFAALFGNTLYAVAISYYLYITFLGYSALPFLKDTEFLLYPIGIVVVFYVLCNMVPINFAISVFEFYHLI
eukprot:Clim_evm24s3 gene=Clim_evmTU24s3